MASFISKESFEKRAEENRILTWKELPVDGTIWKIVAISEYSGLFGRAANLSIINEQGVEKSVKVSKRMLEAIDEKQDGKKIIYFTTMGQVERFGKLINEFELVAI